VNIKTDENITEENASPRQNNLNASPFMPANKTHNRFKSSTAVPGNRNRLNDRKRAQSIIYKERIWDLQTKDQFTSIKQKVTSMRNNYLGTGQGNKGDAV
jgi:hypothetical protein